MTQVKVHHEVGFSADKVWGLMSDYQNVHRFHPAVEKVSQTTSHEKGMGAGRVCHFYDGGSIKETVMQWEEGRFFELDLTEGQMPFKTAKVSLEVRSKGSNRSEVEIAMTYETKFGPLGALMDKMMIRKKLGGMLKQVIIGMEYYLTTGKPVGP